MKRTLMTVAAASALLAMAIPAFAQTAQTTSASKRAAAVQERMVKTQSRDATLIDNRVDSLNKLLARIQEMKRVTDAEKATISSTVQTEINNLTALKAKIASDTGTTTLKADTMAITQAYRIYALIEPQINILAASDRVNTTVGMLSIIATKIQNRLASTTNAAAQSALSDMQAKLADATTQAQTAVSTVSSLQPDNGDKTLMASNTAALKSARAALQAASKDLSAARSDAQTAAKALRPASAKPSTTNQQSQ